MKPCAFFATLLTFMLALILGHLWWSDTHLNVLNSAIVGTLFAVGALLWSLAIIE